jgi:hypothetical protein
MHGTIYVSNEKTKKGGYAVADFKRKKGNQKSLSKKGYHKTQPVLNRKNNKRIFFETKKGCQ